MIFPYFSLFITSVAIQFALQWLGALLLFCYVLRMSLALLLAK